MKIIKSFLCFISFAVLFNPMAEANKAHHHEFIVGFEVQLLKRFNKC